MTGGKCAADDRGGQRLRVGGFLVHAEHRAPLTPLRRRQQPSSTAAAVLSPRQPCQSTATSGVAVGEELADQSPVSERLIIHFVQTEKTIGSSVGR